MTRTKIPASRAALYVQIGHTRDDTPRMMPLNWQGHAGRAEKLLQFPHGTIVESMPWGADKGLPNYGSFGELLTAWLSSSAGYCNQWRDHVRSVIDGGKRHITYTGRTQTELDYVAAKWVFGWIDPRAEFAFDASAPEPEGSYTHRLMQEFPERVFWGEAHPRYEWKSCVAKSPLCYYSRIRKQVELSNKMSKTYLGPDKFTFDADHPEIMIAMTGHGRESFEHDIRDAIRWSRQGHTIAFEPHTWDEFKGSIEIVEGE